MHACDPFVKFNVIAIHDVKDLPSLLPEDRKVALFVMK